MKRFTLTFVTLAIAWLCPDTGHALGRQGGPAAAAAQDPAQPEARKPEPPPPPAERPRRRSSMVGYIDDAMIESQVRIRFESGFGNRAPDRAEFFYGKCGCLRDAVLEDVAPAAFDPNAPGPGPGLANDIDFDQLLFEAEFVVGDRVSIFGELPFRWVQPRSFVPDTAPSGGFGNQGGVGDLRAGVKVALAGSEDYVVTARLQAYFPTGDAGEALGTDHASLEPALLYHHRATDRFAIESQFGFWLPIGGSAAPGSGSDHGYAGNVLYYGIGPSYIVYDGPAVRVAPVIELVGWSVLDGFEALVPDMPSCTVPGQLNPPACLTADAGGTNIVNLKFGARFGFEPGSSIYVGYGHALTDKSWYDDILRLEYRYAF
jgi:hypothetical protein